MNQFIKATAAIAIMAAFGAAQAQSTKVDDTVKQTQKASSGNMPAPQTAASKPKADDTVVQTQKPGSGYQPAPATGTKGAKDDETVRQTQKPGVAADGPEKANNTQKKMKQPQS